MMLQFKKFHVLAIVSVLVLGFGLVWIVVSHNLQLNPVSKSIVYSPLFIGSTQTGPLYSVNLNKPTVTPVVVQPPETGTSTIIDIAKDANSTYFLIYNQATLSSNLFSLNSTNPHPTLQQLTFSNTVKWFLSYDAGSRTFAYNTATVSEKTKQAGIASVTTFNIATAKEKVMGIGSNPTVLPGGVMVLGVNNKDQVIVYNGISGKESVLLSAPSRIFTASPDGKTLIEYNQVSNTLDSYSIQSILSASYVKSEPAPFTPMMLTYLNGKLLVVGESGTTSPNLLLQFAGDKKPVAQFPASTVEFFPGFIATIHS
jgi:hypothetical protein